MFALPAILEIGSSMSQRVVVVDDLDQTEGAQTVTFAIMGRPYEIDLNDKNVEKLEKALAPFIDKARPAGTSAVSRPQRRTVAGAGATVKVDYTDPQHAGKLHRGRVTEEEAAWVRANLDEANRNRSLAGQPMIDPESDQDKRRYGF